MMANLRALQRLAYTLAIKRVSASFLREMRKSGSGKAGCIDCRAQRRARKISYNSGNPNQGAQPIATKDIIPFGEARLRFSEIADEVRAGSEKIITKNSQSYVALIDADRLDYYHRLEQERIHLLLLVEAGKGLDDVANGKVKNARQVLRRLTARRRTA